MFLLIRLVFRATAAVYYWAQLWLPSNRLLRAIRSRRGLKWGLPAMVIGVACFYTAAMVTVVIRDGGPTWLHAVVVVLVIDGFKFVWIGPVSLVLLVKARWREAHARHA